MKILIVAKQSKFEWELEKFKITPEQLTEKYTSEHAKLDAILSSHEGQLRSRQELRELLPEAELVMMSQLNENIKGYDYVISLGGDNSFTYTTHYVDNTPIIGINSDPGRSVGAMCVWSSKDLEIFVQRFRNNNFKVEEWPRLEAKINGELIKPATSEYFMGEKLRDDMTRNILVHDNHEYEQKSSGVIVATGAGTTGWYDSARTTIIDLRPDLVGDFTPQLVNYLRTTPQENLYLIEDNEKEYLVIKRGKKIPRIENKAAFLVTEPYIFKAEPPFKFEGELLPGQELVIHSLNDNQGYLSSDSWHKYDFSRGKTAVIRISDKPLKVIVP